MMEYLLWVIHWREPLMIRIIFKGGLKAFWYPPNIRLELFYSVHDVLGGGVIDDVDP